jgi:hypothetical protein
LIPNFLPIIGKIAKAMYIFIVKNMANFLEKKEELLNIYLSNGKIIWKRKKNKY